MSPAGAVSLRRAECEQGAQRERSVCGERRCGESTAGARSPAGSSQFAGCAER
ncbi:hypothetical protein [Paenibacillus planticolens]|uniref:hypothetical protein n=1 Tax=Paenibacillus planticolens TaxID=2654976 RepID=UPI001491D003|nr:hypothetical protein [Paenibacillus planticolens]